MALRFHARRKIPQRFFPPSQIHPARCRAKAALLNSSSTPSEELTSHVIMVSRALSQRAKSDLEVFAIFRSSLRNIENIFVGFLKQFSIFFQTVSHQISIVHFANNIKIPLQKRVTKDGVLFHSYFVPAPASTLPFHTLNEINSRKKLAVRESSNYNDRET